VKNKLLKLRVGIAILCLVLASIIFIPKAFAGTITNTSVIEMGGASNVNPMIVGDPQSLAIAFTPANTVSSGYTITLTFGYGGTLWTQTSTPTSTSGVIASSGQTVANNSCTTLTGASSYITGSGAGAPSVSSSQAAGTITVTSAGSGDGTLTSGTSYCFELTDTSAVTNPTGAGDYNVNIATNSDNQTVAVDVLTAGANAYSITATIAPTFTMSLSGSTDSFSGNLSSSAVTTSTGITTTIATNAKSGWYLWAEDSNAGLKSTIAGYTIATVSTGANYSFSSHTGAEGYGLGVVTSGTETGITNTTNYAYGGGTTGSVLSTSTFNEIATATGPASGSSGSLTDSIVTHELANILPTTPPATDYTDTITLIGASSF